MDVIYVNNDIDYVIVTSLSGQAIVYPNLNLIFPSIVLALTPPKC